MAKKAKKAAKKKAKPAKKSAKKAVKKVVKQAAKKSAKKGIGKFVRNLSGDGSRGINTHNGISYLLDYFHNKIGISSGR